MDYECSVKRTYSIKLADADIKEYFLIRPDEWRTDETADRIRDILTEAEDVLLYMVMSKADGGDQRGVVGSYTMDLLEKDQVLAIRAALRAKSPSVYWGVHYEVTVEEEVTL